jgi:hypothetical protein
MILLLPAPSQHVTVGIVGGSDLVKIQEQLGSNGECSAGSADGERVARSGAAAAPLCAAAAAKHPGRGELMGLQQSSMQAWH